MISIHQPQFVPWVPYFYKYLMSDVFVLLDHVQYQKNGLQNRNQIKTPQGAQWLTLPVIHTLEHNINEVRLAKSDALSKCLRTLELNYKKAPFFDVVYSELVKIVGKLEDNLLCTINNDFFFGISKLINIEKKVVSSSSLKLEGSKNDLIIEIIKHIGEDAYLTGKGAIAYMDLNQFKMNGIKVYLSEFTYVPYDQLWPKLGFIADLSILDLLFNILPGVLAYMQTNGKVTRLV